MGEYELKELRLHRLTPRSEVRQLLADRAEYGGWELARLRRYPDGTRRIWLRRRIIRLTRTF